MRGGEPAGDDRTRGEARRALALGASLLLTAACGRLGFSVGEDGDSATDTDTNAPDAAPADATPAPDAAPPGPMTVVTTADSGPGSLTAAIDYLNANCGALEVPARRITFAIPLGDPGLVDLDGDRLWRITAVASTSIACAGAVIDGFSQTTFAGDTNPGTVGGMPVGAAGVPLPLIAAPEIELRGLGLALNADGIVVQGLALHGVFTNFDGHTLRGCWLGSEPNAPQPLPQPLRTADGTVLYFADPADGGTNGHLITGNVFVWGPGVAQTRNGLLVGANGPSTISENYLIGTGPGSIWDELHLNPATSLTVQHNYIGGDPWEFKVEWVNATALGSVVDNTFAGGSPTIRTTGGLAPTEAGNIIQ